MKTWTTYLFYIDENGYHPCGNDGTSYAEVGCMSKLRKDAALFLNGRAGKVYAMTRYTQEMCEMDNAQLVAYVRKCGQLLAG